MTLTMTEAHDEWILTRQLWKQMLSDVFLFACLFVQRFHARDLKLGFEEGRLGCSFCWNEI